MTDWEKQEYEFVNSTYYTTHRSWNSEIEIEVEADGVGFECILEHERDYYSMNRDTAIDLARTILTTMGADDVPS